MTDTATIFSEKGIVLGRLRPYNFNFFKWKICNYLQVVARFPPYLNYYFSLFIFLKISYFVTVVLNADLWETMGNLLLI